MTLVTLTPAQQLAKITRERRKWRRHYSPHRYPNRGRDLQSEPWPNPAPL